MSEAAAAESIARGTCNRPRSRCSWISCHPAVRPTAIRNSYTLTVVGGEPGRPAAGSRVPTACGRRSPSSRNRLPRAAPRRGAPRAISVGPRPRSSSRARRGTRRPSPGGFVWIVNRPGPRLRGQRGVAAAQGRVVRRTPACRGPAAPRPAVASAACRAGVDGRPHHLAVRGVAQVVAFGAVPLLVGGGEGADRRPPGPRARRARPRGCPSPGDHPRHVLLDGDRFHANRSAARRQADSNGAPLAGRAQRPVGGRRRRVLDRRRPGWQSRRRRRDDRDGRGWRGHGRIGDQVAGDVRGIDSHNGKTLIMNQKTRVLSAFRLMASQPS